MPGLGSRIVLYFLEKKPVTDITAGLEFLSDQNAFCILTIILDEIEIYR